MLTIFAEVPTIPVSLCYSLYVLLYLCTWNKVSLRVLTHSVPFNLVQDVLTYTVSEGWMPHPVCEVEL